MLLQQVILITMSTANAVEDKEQEYVQKGMIQTINDELKKRGFSNIKITLCPGSDKGDNYMSFITQVTVIAIAKNGQQREFGWITKTAPQSEGYKEIGIGPIFKREVHMYNVFQQFKQFQEENQIVDPFDSYATFITSNLEPLKEYLVLEDVKYRGFVLKNRLEPLDYNHVKLVLKEYGKLHALSFALRDQQPEEFQKLAADTRESFFSHRKDSSHWKSFYKMIGQKLLNAIGEDVIEEVKMYSERAMAVIRELLKSTNRYSVICHGDNWMNNMLWKYENTELPDVPTKVCFVDFQLGRYGSPAQDLSYFIYACVGPEELDKHYDQMIKLYYYSLCKHLMDLNCDPEKLFPFAALKDELRTNSLFGFNMAAMVLNLVLRDRSETPDWSTLKNAEEMRNSMAGESVYDDTFKKRIKACILHMHKMGYFEMLRK